LLRRSFLQLFASGVLLALLGKRGRAASRSDLYAFHHGVASGDPLQDAVILWTRISNAGGEPLTLNWQVARDEAMTDIVASGVANTNADRDYTVKVDARGLPSGALLYYRFTIGSNVSPVGRTRTLPRGNIETARFAVVSCANHPYGYFNAYRDIAEQDDLDAVIHLGDYIYEYGLGQYATERAAELGRIPDPPTELLTLSDYRRRYAQYRSDADLRALHGAHPMIAVWDDHELANDAWRDGAENHANGEDVDEGAWEARRDTAIRAWFEWQPVRGEPAGGRTRIYRDYRYGDLLRLIMLDTRIYGRDPQPDISGTDGTRPSIVEVLNDGKRQLLGRRQQRWLRKRLKKRGTTWQAIGQQVLLSPLNSPDLEPLLDLERPSMVPIETLQQNIALSKSNPPVLLDTWDGYPWARRQLLKDISRHGNNTVVLSGDLHTSIAGNVRLDDAPDVTTVEFMATSVTSPGFAEYLPETRPGAVAEATLKQNPDLRYMETDRRGWLCMTFTHEKCIGEWRLLDTITETDYTVTVDRQLSVAAGNVAAGLQEA
jgi:alkaline phosphatase D